MPEKIPEEVYDEPEYSTTSTPSGLVYITDNETTNKSELHYRYLIHLRWGFTDVELWSDENSDRCGIILERKDG